jgi:hypothetical protein
MLYEHELKKLVEQEIMRIKDEMSFGRLQTYDDYRYVCGKVAGLLMTIELMSETNTILNGGKSPHT